MLSDPQIREAAAALHAAETERRQIRPTSIEYPQMDMGDAYAIQNAWIELKLAEGRVIRGRKIGLTSRAMQDAMQIDEPDYGTLLDDMFFADGAEIEAGQFTDPRIEVELAFVLKQPLTGDDLSVDDVLQATDYVIPALEIIAARSFRVDPETNHPRGVLDTIADNAANAGVVMGEVSVKPTDVDLRWVGALLYRNGIIEETGIAAAVLDHPAAAIAWLAKKFFQHGIALEPGQVILSGSFTRPVTISPGDTFDVDYGELGKVACRFT
ncbi:MAG: 2-oxo-hepta-3-ene-1,7-dioic acid hydratase [Pseudomonadales bacterium]